MGSFNSPGRLNALTVPMAEDFTHTLTKQLMESEVKNIRAVVLTGSGRAFSAGGDIDWLIDRHRQSQNRDANIKTMINFYKSFLGPLRRLPCPVIAAINGPAIGAGACLAVGGCDIRYASTKASLGFTFTKSADLLLSGRGIDSKEALQIGLVDKVCDDPVGEAMSFAQTIAAATSSSAVTQTILTLRKRQEQGLEDSMRREAEAQAIPYATKDFLEGVTAVKEKRNPVFTGE